MPVAEIASTFNENVVMKAAISAASGEEKLALLESRLQSTYMGVMFLLKALFRMLVFEHYA